MCCIPDKAGGNKFAKDFEDGSLKLQEFVGFLDKELKTGPPLLEALGNADIFYEMQYKEVKIVANVSVRSNVILDFPVWRVLLTKILLLWTENYLLLVKYDKQNGDSLIYCM